ncbi:amino acid adenylation domain-containing protein [Paenibacillus sp. BR2-3]|uniref:amino acid adenylation domain-containing protein n=1 Tax=Paenibacillus sp. BR2-3 TaxID=3048494 RepID=UPI00397777C3
MRSNATIHQLFEDKVDELPQHPAVRYNGKSMTYLELNQHANALAHELIRRGIQVNDHVGVIVNRNMNMIVALLAVLKCGAVYIPIDPEYPLNRKNYILNHSGAMAVIVESDEQANVPIRINLQETKGCADQTHNPNIPKSEKDLAYIMYTSGSTGMPKGVMIEHHSAVNLIRWVNTTLQMNSSDRGLFVTSMCFDLSVYDIFGMLAAGGTIVICPNSHVTNPDELRNLLSAERITFWNSVPTTLHYLVRDLMNREEDYAQYDLRHIFLSGDWIPLELARTFKRYFPGARMTSLGGATEAAVWSIYYPVEQVKEEWTSIPYGKPIDQNYFYILDEALQPVPDGEIGELYIGGIGVARGYINDSSKTEKAFMQDPFRNPAVDRMYKTGDLGRMQGDGNIEFLGRCDDQVKIRGFRVEIKEVEKQLLNYPAIRDAVVVPKNAKADKYLCAYLTAGQTVQISGIRKHLEAVLPAYMIPSVFIMLEQFPLNQNGKVDKKQLPEVSLDSILTDTEYTPCSNSLQQTICKAWERVLGLVNIGINHDFFDIGGTSIEAVTLHTELHLSGIPLSYDDLITHTTVAAQARLMEETGEPEVRETSTHTKHDLKLKPMPFNDLYYKSCLYNSLFPAVHYFDRNINSFLSNDIFVYTLESAHGHEYLAANCIESRRPEEILQQLQLSVLFEKSLGGTALAERLVEGLDRQNLFILWVDSFYEPGRRDVYLKKHIAHTLLVYGYDEVNDHFYILEHSHKDALNYKERTLSATDLLNSYSGYQQHLMSAEEPYTFIEFPSFQKPYRYEAEHDRRKLIRNYEQHRHSVLDGLSAVTRFKESYSGLLRELDVWSVSRLIGNLNAIIDFKRAEKYRMERIFAEQCEAISIFGQIIDGWLIIRNDLIKWTKGIALLGERGAFHYEIMETLCQKELDILETMCGLDIHCKEGKI